MKDTRQGRRDNNVQTRRRRKYYDFVLLTYYYEMEMDMAGDCLQRGSSKKQPRNGNGNKMWSSYLAKHNLCNYLNYTKAPKFPR